MHREPNFVQRGTGGGAESSAGQQGDNTETTGRLPVVYWGKARREWLTGSGEGCILALDAADYGLDRLAGKNGALPVGQKRELPLEKIGIGPDLVCMLEPVA